MIITSIFNCFKFLGSYEEPSTRHKNPCKDMKIEKIQVFKCVGLKDKEEEICSNKTFLFHFQLPLSLCKGYSHQQKQISLPLTGKDFLDQLVLKLSSYLLHFTGQFLEHLTFFNLLLLLFH